MPIHILFVFFLALAFILQPFQILIGLIIRFLWKPPSLSEEMKQFQKTDAADKSIAEIYAERTKSLDRHFLQSHHDAGKFWSMYAWQSGEQSAWDAVMRMVDVENKTLHRNPREYWYQDEKTFSGDQLSGFMGAVASRIVEKGLTVGEKTSLTEVWERVSFCGFPMLIPHYVNGKSLSLGFVWRPWQIWNISSLVKLLAWLMLGYEITGKIKYLVYYRITLILFFPALMLASPDGEIFVGKYYACSANASHSLMLDLASGYMIDEPWTFEHIMRKVGKKRWQWSADWLALWGAYFGELSAEQYTVRKNLIWSTARKKAGDNSALTADYFDLVHFEKQIGFPQIETPGKRFCDYTDERHLTVPENFWNNQNRSAEQTAIDVLFPAGLFLNKEIKRHI